MFKEPRNSSSQRLVYTKTIAGKMEGRRQQIGPFLRAPFFARRLEAFDGTRHTGCAPADEAGFGGIPVGTEVHIAGGALWRRFTEIDKVHFPVGQANQQEPAAADVACGRMSDSKRKSNRNGRIDGITAVLSTWSPTSAARGSWATTMPCLAVAGSLAASGEQMKKDRRARVQTPERRGRGGIRCQSSLVGGEEDVYAPGAYQKEAQGIKAAPPLRHSNRTTPAATDTLREATSPAIGMRTRKSQCFLTFS